MNNRYIYARMKQKIRRKALYYASTLRNALQFTQVVWKHYSKRSFEWEFLICRLNNLCMITTRFLFFKEIILYIYSLIRSKTSNSKTTPQNSQYFKNPGILSFCKILYLGFPHYFCIFYYSWSKKIIEFKINDKYIYAYAIIRWKILIYNNINNSVLITYDI